MSGAWYPTRDMIGSAWVFFGLAVTESAVLHLLLFALGHNPFWLAIALVSDAGVVAALVMIRSLSRRPTTIDGARVVVQVGLLFWLEFSANAVDLDAPAQTGLRMLNGALLANPNLVLVFRKQQMALIGGFLRRPVDGIRLKLAEADEFLAALKAAAV